MNPDLDAILGLLENAKNTLTLMRDDNAKTAERENDVSYFGYWRGRESAFETARLLVDSIIDVLQR